MGSEEGDTEPKGFCVSEDEDDEFGDVNEAKGFCAFVEDDDEDEDEEEPDDAVEPCDVFVSEFDVSGFCIVGIVGNFCDVKDERGFCESAVELGAALSAKPINGSNPSAINMVLISGFFIHFSFKFRMRSIRDQP